MPAARRHARSPRRDRSRNRGAPLRARRGGRPLASSSSGFVTTSSSPGRSVISRVCARSAPRRSRTRCSGRRRPADHLTRGALDRVAPDPRTTKRVGQLQAPPLPDHFASFAPAELYRYRLPSRKATTLVRICRSFDPERLRRLPADAAAARLEQERGHRPVLGRRRLDAGARALRPRDRRRPRAAQDLLGDRGPLGRARGHGPDPRSLRGVGRARVRVPDGRREARPRAVEADSAAKSGASASRLGTPPKLSAMADERSPDRDPRRRQDRRVAALRACSARAGASPRRSSSPAAGRSGSTSSPSATGSRRRFRTPRPSPGRRSS